MNKILSSLLIAAAVSSAVVFAEDTLRTTVDNNRQRVAFTLHGKTSCVLVEDKVFCAPAVIRAPIRLASTLPN
jgi:hypothetical protein